MSTPSPEKVFPAPTTPPAPSPAGGAGGSLGALKRVDKKVWMALGAAVVVVLGLVTARGGADDETDATELSDPYGFESQGGDDVVNAIEDLGERIEDIRIVVPVPAQPAAPKPNQPGPRPNQGAPARKQYMVKKNDTLKEIAAKFKVKGGAAKLYQVNRAVITKAAQEHKHPRPKTAWKLYAGTMLVIP